MTQCVLRRYKETDTQFATREFNYCMWQIGRCHDLQAERVRMGWEKPAIHYQTQAAIWYERAVECRARYTKALADLIPGTQVRWDEIFTIQYVLFFGRGQRIGPGSVLYVHPDAPEHEWNEIFTLIPNMRSSKIIKDHHGTDESRFIGDGVDELAEMLKSPDIPNDARKLASSTAYGKFNKPFKWKTIPDPRPREAHYTSPKAKYDNPHDVPFDLDEISQKLKRWLS